MRVKGYPSPGRGLQNGQGAVLDPGNSQTYQGTNVETTEWVWFNEP